MAAPPTYDDIIKTPPGQPVPTPYPPASGMQQSYPPTVQTGGYQTTQGTPYPTVAGIGQTTVVVQQPAAVMLGRLGEIPILTQCSSCHQQVTTRVHFDSGNLTWLACLGLCLIGCNLGCCLIPFCVNGLQDAVHSCPNCNAFIGRYNRL